MPRKNKQAVIAPIEAIKEVPATVEAPKVSKKVRFSLRQSNGNNVSFELSDLSTYNNDTFAGTVLFPALLRLCKGASKLFDRKLPISLSFAFEQEEGTYKAKVIADITMVNSAYTQVRKACLVFNEAIAGLVIPDEQVSIYAIDAMRKDKGAALRAFSLAAIRPSVKLDKALAMN
jgi:hypothetical protein